MQSKARYSTFNAQKHPVETIRILLGDELGGVRTPSEDRIPEDRSQEGQIVTYENV